MNDMSHLTLRKVLPTASSAPRAAPSPHRARLAAGAGADTAAGVPPRTGARSPAPILRLVAGLQGLASRVIPPILAMIALLLVWQISCSGQGASLPPPSKVFTDTWYLIAHPFFDNGGVDKGLFWHLLASLKRVAVGYGLAAVAGIALGTLIGQSSAAYRGLDPIFQVLRTVPPLAWLPISLAAFRNADPSAIFVILITSIWPIILNTAVGIRQIPVDYRNVARVIRLSPVEYFFKIMIPATVPYMFTGLRIGIGLSWLAIVAAEMLVGGVGIGFFIWDGWNSSLISEIILALIYVGIVGFLLDRAVALIGSLIAGRSI